MSHYKLSQQFFSKGVEGLPLIFNPQKKLAIIEGENYIEFPQIRQGPISFIDYKMIRDNYIVIPLNEYGLVFVDFNFNVIKKLFIARNIFIHNVHVKYDESELILNCYLANDCLFKVKLQDYSIEMIQFHVPTSERYNIFSRIYYWKEDFIVLFTESAGLIKVDLKKKDYSFITLKQLSEIDLPFTRFFKHMKKNCKPHSANKRVRHSITCIKNIDYYRYIYICRDPDDKEDYVIDYVRNTKLVLAPWYYWDYTFDYRFDYFATTNRFFVELFHKGKRIMQFDEADRRYFGGKIIQDLNERYLLVLDGCMKTNKGLRLRKFRIPPPEEAIEILDHDEESIGASKQ